MGGMLQVVSNNLGSDICGLLTFLHEARDDFKVNHRDEREDWYKDQEVDLSWRGCQSVNIVPVRDYGIRLVHFILVYGE
jgi:hypothetical protein